MLTKREITNPSEQEKTRYIRVASNLDFCKYVAKVAGESATESIVDQYAERLRNPKAMYDFVRQYAYYSKDPSTMDTLRRPSMVLARIKRGQRVGLDCDCATCLLAALLINKGYIVRVVPAHIIKASEKKSEYKHINHIFLQFKDKNKWISLEPSSRMPLAMGSQHPSVLPLYYIYITVGGSKLNDEI